MKSVVVEASTVAKAVETAWLKAEKPEEFFIKVLQEHSSGFLGFGAKKAKIVFFFKNIKKSDSLFPVVVKQKEYSNFFENSNLKVPAQVDVIDTELNKNVVLGSQQKKNKYKQNKQSSDKRSVQHHTSHTKSTESFSVNKPVVHKTSHLDKNTQGRVVKQVKINQPLKTQQSSAKKLTNSVVEKPVVSSPKMQVSLETPKVAKKPIIKKSTTPLVDTKNDIVKDVTKVLKKVQTQKIVSNVSRPSSKFSTQKFETYDDFINSTTGIPVNKDILGQQETAITPQVESVVKAEPITPRLQEKSVASQTQGNVDKKIASAPKVKRAPLKFKRRPLTTENSGVSGITRSSLDKTSKPVNTSTDTAIENKNSENSSNITKADDVNKGGNE